MTPPGVDDGPLDVFALAARLLPGVALTPSQLAGVRAANTKYFTALFALQERARSEGREWVTPSATERAELQAMLVRELRSVARDDAQRAMLERQVALLDS